MEPRHKLGISWETKDLFAFRRNVVIYASLKNYIYERTFTEIKQGQQQKNWKMYYSLLKLYSL